MPEPFLKSGVWANFCTSPYKVNRSGGSKAGGMTICFSFFAPELVSDNLNPLIYYQVVSGRRGRSIHSTLMYDHPPQILTSSDISKDNVNNFHWTIFSFFSWKNGLSYHYVDCNQHHFGWGGESTSSYEPS